MKWRKLHGALAPSATPHSTRFRDVLVVGKVIKELADNHFFLNRIKNVMAKTSIKSNPSTVKTPSKKTKLSTLKDGLTPEVVAAATQAEIQKHFAKTRAKGLAAIRSKKIRTNTAISKLLNSARDAVNTLSADGWNAIVDFRSDGIHYYRSLGQISTLMSEFMRADMAMGVVDGNAELAPDEKTFEYARLGRERDAVLDQLEMALEHSRMYARAYW